MLDPILIGSLYRLILVIGISLAIYLIIGLLQQRQSPGAKTLIAFLLAISLSLFCFFAQSIPTNPYEAFVWARLRFLGLFLAAPLTYNYTLIITGTVRRRWALMLLLLPSILVQMLLTSETWAATEYFRDWTMVTYGTLALEQTHFTSLATIARLFAYFPGILAVFKLFRYARRSSGHQQRQAYWLLAAIALAFLAAAPTTMTGKIYGINPTPIGLAIFPLIAAWMFRSRTFAIMPVAYETVLRNMRDAVLVLTPQHQIISANPIAHALFPQTSIIGLPVDAVLTEEAFLRQYRPLQPAAAVDLEAAIGQVQHLHEISISPILTTQGMVEGRIIVLHDIEHRRRDEEALRQNETQLRLITENMTDIVVQSDLRGNMIYVSPSVERVLGFTPDYWRNLPPEGHFAAVHPDDQPIILKAYQDAIATGLTGRAEYRLRSSRDEYVWMEAIFDRVHTHLSNPDSLIISMRDITQRRHAEEIHRKQETQMRLITENMADMVVQADFMGNIMYVSPSMEKVLGYSADYWLNLPDVERYASIHPDDLNSLINAFQTSIDMGSAGQVEYRQRTASGEYIWLESNIERVQVAAGETASLIITSRNITRRKQIEEALRTGEEQARHFRDRLQNLHRLTLELAGIDQWDDLTRRIVEGGRELLQIDRLALMVENPDTGYFVGTFGTDAEGKTTDERQYVATAWGNQQQNLHYLDYLDHGLIYQDDVDLYFNDQVVGHGWRVIAYLPSDTHPAGAIIADNLITGRPFTPDDRTLFQFFAALVGSTLVRQRTLDTMRESEERYRSISNLISDYAYSYTVHPDGSMSTEWVTDSYTRITGYVIGEIDRSGGAYNLYPPDEQSRVQADVKAVLSGSESAGDYRILTKQGEERWLHISRYPTWNAEKTRVIRFYGVAKDITQRKQAEIILRENEDRYRSTIEAMQEGLILTDRNGIQMCNKAAERIIGLSTAQMIGKGSSNPVWRTIHEDGSPFPPETHPIARVMQTGLPQTNITLGMYRPDQSLIWLLLNSQPMFKEGADKPYSVVTTFIDISERKQMEDALRRSEEQYRLIAENTSDGIAVWDEVEKRIMYASPAYDRLLGLEPGTTISRMQHDLFEAIHPDDQKVVKNQFREAVRQRQSSVTLAYRMRHQDGHYVWKEDRLSLNFGMDGSFTGSYIISRDISERKLGEQRQLELTLEKERASILTHFIEKASHEFRTPLSIINSASSFMVRLDDVERKRAKAETVEQQVMRINKLVHMLLVMTRIRSQATIEYAPIDIQRMIRAECQSMVKKYGAAPRLEQQLAHSLPTMQGSANDLADALQQVLDNAFRYTPPEGTITVTSGADETHVWIEVRDTGSGISAESLPHIFETFWREDKPHTTPGFGIGLPIAQRVMELHNGQITVESKVGEGTTVRMTLPLNPPTA